MDPFTIETIVLDLLQLVLQYVSQPRASELLMQAARNAANLQEDAKFGPDREAPTGR